MKLIRLRVEAEIELLEAALWYEAQRATLGFESDEEVHAVLQRVSESPKQFPIVEGEVRRGVVDPYGVFFVEGDQEIVVIGVVHLHRDPETWRAR